MKLQSVPKKGSIAVTPSKFALGFDVWIFNAYLWNSLINNNEDFFLSTLSTWLNMKISSRTLHMLKLSFLHTGTGALSSKKKVSSHKIRLLESSLACVKMRWGVKIIMNGGIWGYSQSLTTSHVCGQVTHVTWNWWYQVKALEQYNR